MEGVCSPVECHVPDCTLLHFISVQEIATGSARRSPPKCSPPSGAERKKRKDVEEATPREGTVCPAEEHAAEDAVAAADHAVAATTHATETRRAPRPLWSLCSLCCYRGHLVDLCIDDAHRPNGSLSTRFPNIRSPPVLRLGDEERKGKICPDTGTRLSFPNIPQHHPGTN